MIFNENSCKVLSEMVFFHNRIRYNARCKNVKKKKKKKKKKTFCVEIVDIKVLKCKIINIFTFYVGTSACKSLIVM